MGTRRLSAVNFRSAATAALRIYEMTDLEQPFSGNSADSISQRFSSLRKACTLHSKAYP